VDDRRRRLGRIDPFLYAAAAQLKQASTAIREAVDHRGEIGRGHEMVLRNQLQALLPARIDIRTGSVIGAGATISRQLDLILCDAQNYPAFSYVAGDLILPDSVFGVISVKTILRPADMPVYFAEGFELKRVISEALGVPWNGFYVVLGYWVDGSPDALMDRYYTGVLGLAVKRSGLDLVAAIDRGPIGIDLATFGDPPGQPPAFLAHRAHIPGIAFDACTVDSDEPFIDVYKLLLRVLDPRRLSRIVDLAGAAPGLVVAEGVSTDRRFHATFAGKSADLRIPPGLSQIFSIFYANTGAIAWIKDTATEARLVVAGPRGYVLPQGWGPTWPTVDVYCVQTQVQVDPGSLATFTFEITPPAETPPGTYRFYGRPAIAGIGALTQETRSNTVEVVGDAAQYEQILGPQRPGQTPA
jgi:hypothetical protein